MSTRQKKIEKHRRRRQEKQRQQRVLHNHRVQDYLSDRHELYACYANADWKTAGMASLFVARRVAIGQVSLAAFLVDYWGMGLKDAWGETVMSIADFEEYLERVRARMNLTPIDPVTAQHLVWGGVEVARTLGFRLPRHHDRWTSLIGTLPEGVTPDMNLFGKNGKVHIRCSEADLHKRYLGDPNIFLARPDVEFVIGDSNFSLLEDEEDELIDFEGDATDNDALAPVLDWCAEEGQRPSPILFEVYNAMNVAAADVLKELTARVGPDDEVTMGEKDAQMLIRRVMTQMKLMGYEELDVAEALSQIICGRTASFHEKP